MSSQLMTDVERAVVENLKLYPEMILDTKKETVALCNRCDGVIPIDSACLDRRWLRGRTLRPLIDAHLAESCPACGANKVITLPDGTKPTSFASFRKDNSGIMRFTLNQCRIVRFKSRPIWSSEKLSVLGCSA